MTDFRQKAAACYAEYKQSHDPAEAAAADAYNEAADEIERLAALVQPDAEPKRKIRYAKSPQDVAAEIVFSHCDKAPSNLERSIADAIEGDRKWAALAQSDAEPEYYSYPDMDGITTRNVIPKQSAAEPWRLSEEARRQLAEIDRATVRQGDPRMNAVIGLQSDAEPVAWRWRHKTEPDEWHFIVNALVGNELLIVEPLYTAPPRPDTSAGLIEAAEEARDLLNGRHNVGSDAYKAFCILNAAISRARAADRSGK